MWVGVKGSFDVFGYLRGPHEEFEKVVLMFWGHVNFTTRRRATTAEMKKRKNLAFSIPIAAKTTSVFLFSIVLHAPPLIGHDIEAIDI